MQDDSTTEKTKYCRGCDTLKPVSEFGHFRYKHDNKRFGKQSRCKECTRKAHKEYMDARKARYKGPTVDGKECDHCHQVKFAIFFTKSVNSKDGLDPRCIACKKKLNKNFGKTRGEIKEAALWTLYRLRPEQHQAILESQGEKCAICRGEMTVPCVDHCHKTGRVRGILCTYCNAMLSGIETEGFVERARTYLAAKCVVDTGMTEKTLAYVNRTKWKCPPRML